MLLIQLPWSCLVGPYFAFSLRERMRLTTLMMSDDSKKSKKILQCIRGCEWPLKQEV